MLALYSFGLNNLLTLTYTLPDANMPK